MINLIEENNFISELTKQFERSPFQFNKLHESDAEIIDAPFNTDYKIAITTDTIAEEIELGIYDDPYLIGWMIVMVNLSDLAAVGASPMGIVISELIPKSYSQKELIKLQQGISDACNICNTFVLGGDTNYSKILVLSGAALGIIKEKPLSRIGCKVGDLLYSSGKIGTGNTFALTKILNGKRINYNYKPTARLKESQILLKFATACMDTSDGIFSTLDQLMRLNNFGFELNCNWESALDNKAKNILKKLSLPSWFLLAGQHGEFELIFTISKEQDLIFKNKAESINWNPEFLGFVIMEPKIKVPLYSKIINIDTEKIRNLPLKNKLDIKNYLKALTNLDEEFKKPA
ncbi:MAG: thiamine-monophosphate kinase [Ignavibacteriae bacterium]|nr:thiamine-monophosphate kinase [Ignavibacteriota bacterium]NOG98412.1 thiamine-monophosphate kinase [Ignavibacteriota bacterium]